MRKMLVKQVDAFTSVPFGGNPAGVITDGDGLQTEEMLRIAGEMNLSETAFVTAPHSDEARFGLRFFTPSNEVDLSGHVVIAAAWALAEEGRIPLDDGVNTFVFDTNAGGISVDMHFRRTETPGTGSDRVALRNDFLCGELLRIMMRQSIHRCETYTLPISEIAAILGIAEREITATGLPVEIISTGLTLLMIPVVSKETIMNMNPDLIKLGILNRKHGLEANHIFTMDTYDPGCVSYARHFAPVLGMWEDPGTGTASAALGTYLLRHGVVTSGAMVLEQGNDAAGLARIIVEVEESGIDGGSARIGGLAITSITREITLDSGSILIA